MMKNSMNPLKALALFTVVIGLAFTTSCNEDDEDPDCEELTWYEDADGDGLGNSASVQLACEQPEGYVDNDDDDDDTQGEPTQNIWELVEGTEGLDSLEKYLNVYPDLVATLEAEGTFTLFAPDNDAFISLLNTPGFPEKITSINPDIIKNVLAYHVSTTEYTRADMTAGTEIATASQGNELIVVNSDGTLFTGSTNDMIEIKTADRAATNGVMHVTASVLIPPTVGATLTPILGTNAGTLLLGADFSLLAEAITKSEEYAATSDQIPSLVGVLSGEAVHTVFAPTNATFQAAADGQAGNGDGEASEEEITAFMGSFTAQQFYGIVANHVVIGDSNPDDSNDVIDVSELTTGASFTTAAGGTLAFYQIADAGDFTDIFIDANGDFDPTTGAGLDAEVAAPNAADSGNGTVHVIAGLLVPAQ